MTPKRKKTPAQSNWKVTEETLKKVNQACLDLDVTQSVLAETALRALSTQGSYASSTTVKPTQPDTYADFEIDEAALRQFQIPAAGRAEFVSAAPHLQLEGIPEPDPDVTPQNEHERALVQAVLALDRENGDYPEFRKIMYVLLERWLPKGFKFNSGKKTA